MADDHTWILGINAYDHDVAACLLRDGEPIVAIAKERLTRQKHHAGFYEEAVDYCLAAAGIVLTDVARIVRNCYVRPVGEMERRLAHQHHPDYLPARERSFATTHALFAIDSPRVHDISHHLAHAYSAFAASPFAEGAVMIVDGVGSYRRDVTESLPDGDEGDPLAREAESYYRFEGNRLTPLEKVWLAPRPGLLADEFYSFDGLGALYSRVSSYVFGHWNHCGEVMGLAPYGRPDLEPLLAPENGRLTARPWDGVFRNPNVDLEDEAWIASPHRTDWEDLARRIQEDTETILIERARTLHERTGAKNLCLAGGVALNCVANGRLLEETPFEEIFIQPAAGDDGIALGCALWGHLEKAGGRRTRTRTSVYLGRTYGDDVIASALSTRLARTVTKRRRVADPARHAAKALADGRVLGWFQGGSEFGPRALGNRSILADPRDPDMKDRVNARVKHRQGFRPFAPAVLAERAEEFFEGEAESPYMLLVKRVRPDRRDAVPAITHVDGTARVQTVRREDNPRFHALISAFAEITGVPLVLNTSFNVRGQPIVETPDEALETFLGCGLDLLLMHDHVIEKRVRSGVLEPLIRRAALARGPLRSDH